VRGGKMVYSVPEYPLLRGGKMVYSVPKYPLLWEEERWFTPNILCYERRKAGILRT